MEINDRFIAGVYRSSIYAWGAGALLSVGVWGWIPALGWTVGAAVSVGTLCSTEWIVRRAFVPDNVAARAQLNRFSVLKLLALIATVSLVVLVGGRSFEFVLGFCAGAILTQAVICLRVVSGLVRRRPNDVGEEQ